ncbi:MAG: HAMP domain-containing histidine kinase [Bacteroidetes bacterium]|nr:HAMP domain-containing histidine kinase [Bacteroidota bacterium]
MFKNLSISTKFFLTFVPIFMIGIAASIYLNNEYQQEQMQAEALQAANEKALIVRESLVNMMVESQMVDDSYLEKVKHAANLHDLYIRIDTARLRLAEDFMDSTRAARLGERITLANGKGEYDIQYGTQVLATGKQQWLILGDDFKAMIPFVAEKKCLRCHDVQIGDVLGVAHLDFPLTRLIEANERNSQRAAMISGGVALVVLGAGFLFFRSLVRTPLRRLETAAEAIGKGDMSDTISLPAGEDEVGRLAGAFAQMRSALKQSQDAMRISTVGQVAASLVQDFRAPLSTITTAIEELKRSPQDEAKKQQLLDEAKGSAQQVNRMTQDLIDFTSGELRVDKQLAGIGKLLRTVGTAVRPELERQQIRIDVKDKYDGQAIIDAERTARALGNIILYAANYIPAGGSVTLVSDTVNGRLHFTVSDTGSGIPAGFREKIFEPFVKVVQSGGVGLDLALAKRIIEKQNGTITVTSEEGKGTTYKIEMPM